MAKKQLTERLIPLEKIDEPEGVIRLDVEDDAIKTLSASINALGLLQAILVRPAKDRFEIIYGHRRFLACRLLGMSKIRATVQELTDIQAAMMRATENVERVDISPIEEAAVYQDLVETHKLSLDKIAGMMGKSSGIIRRRLDLLRMPDCLQIAIHKKEINYSVGETLWQLQDQGEIEYYLVFAIENGASRNTVLQWVKEALDKRRRKDTDVGTGGGLSSPMEVPPQYVACDVCRKAMEIGKETLIRACPDCTGLIKKALETAP
jgi:ParB family chromosome partitioning protein